jgi:hypothetical protein
MRHYTVKYFDTSAEDSRLEYFACQADNEAHARKQCDNAYPGCKIASVDADPETGAILVVGNLSAGFRFVGPFPSFDEAAEYADSFIDDTNWIATLDYPAMETRASIQRKTASGEWA